MDLIESVRMQHSLQERYSLAERSVTRTCVLEWLYDVARVPGYRVISQNIDEPFGVDSDWQHFEGELTEGLDKASFVGKYRDLDLEWVSTLGILLGMEVMVGFSLVRSELALVCPENISESDHRRILETIESVMEKNE